MFIILQFQKSEDSIIRTSTGRGIKLVNQMKDVIKGAFGVLYRDKIKGSFPFLKAKPT